MSKRLPPQHERILVEFLTELFSGKNPNWDPTESNPIPVHKLYEEIWSRTGWGNPPEQEAKKSNGAWGNVRSAVRHMLDHTDCVILSSPGSGKSGYYRPTQPHHYDEAYQTAYALSHSFRLKAEAILRAKGRHFPNGETPPSGGLFNSLFE